MHKNKVVSLLKSLSAEEMRQLDKFVRSPIHNQHNEVVALFQYLRKHLNGGKRALQKAQVFEHLYPGEPFVMQKVHYINSYLLKTVEEFLAWQEWRKENSTFGRYLLKSYSAHKLEKQFEKCLSATVQAHHKQPVRDSNFFLQSYLFQLEEYSHARTLGRTREFNLQQLSDTHDIAYIAEKLKNACILISHQAVAKTTYQTGLLGPLLEFLKGHPYLDIPVVAIYYHAYHALSDLHEDNPFYQLKKMLLAGSGAFSAPDLRDLYILAINYCIRRLNNGDQMFMREAFEIYQSGLKEEVFLDNGVFSPWTYSNIVMAGIKLNEFEWVEHFIYQYKDTLPAHQKEGFFNYNLARLFYEKKKYDKAMPLLLRMETSDILHTCSAKTLLAKMYFELGEFDSLSSLLSSFKIFIQRKKMLGYHRDSYNNFITFLARMVHGKAANNPSQLNTEITASKIVAEKDWLLSQLEK